jgi:catechol 2,3-dioxygenase-like lactoylglutathione lyase family enzyme
MPIVGLEGIVYGVDDVEASTRFLADFGLEKEEVARAGARLRVREEGTWIDLRAASDVSLPPAIEAGPTMREIVWAVSDQASLDRIGAELARDRAVTIDREGCLHTIGPMGYGLAFALTKAKREREPPRPKPMARANNRVAGYDRAIPDHLGHLGVFTPNMDEMAAFYINRLGFTLSDSIKGFGKFVRAPGSINHHNLLIAFRPSPGLQHLSLRVTDIDELGVGIGQMERQGWNRAWGPGRHRPGSDMFVFFKNPAGSYIEYHCDEDFITDAAQWTPREFETQGMQHWGGRPPAEMVSGR